MLRTHGNRPGKLRVTEIDVGQSRSHRVRGGTMVVGAAEPELPFAVAAPAFHCAIRGKGASVHSAESQGLCAESRPQLGVGQRVSHVERTIAAQGVAAITELHRFIVAPTLHPSVSENGATKVFPGEHGSRKLPVTELHVQKRVAHFTWIVPAGIVVAKAELAEAILTPTFQAMVVKHGTSVMCPSGNLQRSATAPELDGQERVAHLVWFVAARERVPASEFTRIIPAPAEDAAILESGANMVAAYRNLGNSAALAEIYWK
jgi:hypothetical protein